MRPDSNASVAQVVLAVGNMYEFNERHNQHLSDEQIIQRRTQKEHFAVSAEMALFWGDSIPSRIVILPEEPDPRFVDLIATKLHVRVECLTPKLKTGWVCRDLLEDGYTFSKLLKKLSSKKVAIIPWGTTSHFYQLVNKLKAQGILLSEAAFSPCSNDQRITDLLDSKVGARQVFEAVSTHCSDLNIPSGRICYGRQQAAEYAYWIAPTKNTSVVLKSNWGAGGKGIRLFFADGGGSQQKRSIGEYLSKMQEEDLWGEGVPIIVEELIGNGDFLSTPTYDAYIKEDGTILPMGSGAMILQDKRFYTGVEMGKGALAREVEVKIHQIGLAIGQEIYKRGYRGWYDVDFLAPNSGKIFCSEINARRTGPTQVIELGRQLYGPDWQESHFFKMYEHFDLPQSICNSRLLHMIFARVNDEFRNLDAQALPVFTRSIRLNAPYIGYIVYAPTREGAQEIEKRLQERLRQELEGILGERLSEKEEPVPA